MSPTSSWLVEKWTQAEHMPPAPGTSTGQLAAALCNSAVLTTEQRVKPR